MYNATNIKSKEIKTMKKYYTTLLLLSTLLVLGCNSGDEKNSDASATEVGDNEDGGTETEAGGTQTDTNGTLAESSQSLPLVTSETCANTVALDTRSTTILANQYTLIFPSNLQSASSMRYCSDIVEDLGAAFEIDYVDYNGTGMDGYINGVIGGVQQSGSWEVGDIEKTGMPVLLSNLDDSFIIQWKVSQENALEESDKWMASINVIFGMHADTKTENRDYDLVIESDSHNFDNSTEDEIKEKKSNYLARYEDGSLRTFDIVVEGKTYRYGVRYKFYRDSGDKDDKVHVKYIPIDEANVPPYLNHPLKAFVDNSKGFIQYANMPEDLRALAHEKVALPNSYVKAIGAGYEAYRGESILRNDYFRVILK